MASIKKRNERYCVIYTYSSGNGKRKQKWETYKTLAEAKARRKEIEYKEMRGALRVTPCISMKELLKEYVDLYGKYKWSLSTYNRNTAMISNYILPFIGEMKLSDVNTRFLERYYQQLQKTPAVANPMTVKSKSEYVTASIIRDIHKLIRSCFEQAVKWEMMEKNPAAKATVPGYKPGKRQIWTADILMHAIEVCDDDILRLAMNLSFAASLRIGEVLGLTWDCIDVSQKAVEENSASLLVNKELQRVSKEAVLELEGKDIIQTFPESSHQTTTVRVLKTPKTESSVRRVYLPRSVAEMLQEYRVKQKEIKEMMGDEYQEYNLVLTTVYGLPVGAPQIRRSLQKLIRENDLPPVVFHSIRHSSITYKLKLNGGNIKAVQGDSGHSQVNMVTDVYSHIIDEDRRKNAELFEQAFYKKENLNPQMKESAGADGGQTVIVPEGIDPQILSKVLENPEMAALLASMAKAMQNT